ncbi:hypothetical protein [Streptomyces mirabilis]|uniref:hypothetical protein n=1 Tax=Streptomyces mirabilis TaxID=68239 RepID=UPI0006BA9ED6|nr:hypothetical protein [Streptomyces mirabilis]KPI17974.1 hypothetical protein OK006_10398 [Actinobacteria bacterium OK006]MCX4427080.1 hypothetical protein [Streptomyces mirabilis]
MTRQEPGKQQARERGADPDDIEEVITRATIASVRSHLTVAMGRLREQHQAKQEPAATAPDTTRPDRERSEYQATEAMTALLLALGVTAQTINTGGNCWATSIALTKTARLEIYDFPGDAWSWALHHEGEQVMGGHWGTADDQAAANKAKALIDAMGSIVT